LRALPGVQPPCRELPPWDAHPFAGPPIPRRDEWAVCWSGRVAKALADWDERPERSGATEQLVEHLKSVAPRGVQLELAALAGVGPLESELPHWEPMLSEPMLPELMLPEQPFAPLDEQRWLVALRRGSSPVVWKLSAALLDGQPPELLARRSVLLVAAAWLRQPK